MYFIMVNLMVCEFYLNLKNVKKVKENHERMGIGACSKQNKDEGQLEAPPSQYMLNETVPTLMAGYALCLTDPFSWAAFPGQSHRRERGWGQPGHGDRGETLTWS